MPKQFIVFDEASSVPDSVWTQPPVPDSAWMKAPRPSVATPTDNYRKVIWQGKEWMERCYIVTGGGAEPRLEWRSFEQIEMEADNG